MIKTIALVLLAALALLLAYAATRPDSFRVERSRVIPAPPERVFGLIHDLRQFNRWNPYERPLHPHRPGPLPPRDLRRDPRQPA